MSGDQLVARKGITFFEQFFQKMNLSDWWVIRQDNSGFRRLLRLGKNNWIEFMDLPWSGYVPINDFYIRNPLERREGAVYEKSNHT